MVESISEKQKRMAELKSKGLTNRAIAKIEYPQTDLHNAEVVVSRQLKKPNVAKYIDKGREAALRRYSITWDILIAKLTMMLNANKTDFSTGELIPDNTTQLQAIKTLITMLDKKTEPINNTFDYTNLQRAIDKGTDEVELQRLVFKKNEPITKI